MGASWSDKQPILNHSPVLFAHYSSGLHVHLEPLKTAYKAAYEPVLKVLTFISAGGS